MRFAIILILSVLPYASLRAQEQNVRQQAQEMNRRAELAMKKVADRSNRDSVSIYRAVIDGVSYTLKCDEYDRMPDRKGEIKTKYATENKKRLSTLCHRLFAASNFFYRQKNEMDAQQALVLYMNAMECPLMKDMQDDSGLAAYHLALMELNHRSYKRADRYADMALAYDNSARLAAEVKAQCMQAQMVTAKDSAKYLAVVNKLYETDPNNEKYFSWIMRFYDRPQQRHKLEYFVDKQLEDNPNSIVPWILKGEIAMKARRWDEAIEAYKNADEIDPSNIPVAYNIGVCINNKVAEMQAQPKQESNSDYSVKQLLAESRTYLERVRGRDPHRKKVDWVKPLYTVYTVLGEKVKADELEPLTDGFKNKIK